MNKGSENQVGQPGMFNPGPIGHGVGIGIQGRQFPTMLQEVESGPKMPTEIRLCQRLEREVHNDEQEQSIEGRELSVIRES